VVGRARSFTFVAALVDTNVLVYRDEELVRIAIRGAATYGLSWFDAHLWAYAERFGLDTLWSEDFENGRLYGRVRVRDPFVASA
jgi:predicted nucleic acid-binding protein